MKESKINIIIILFCLTFFVGSGVQYTAHPDKTTTFNRFSGLPEVDRGIAVIETQNKDVMSIGLVK